MAKNHAEAEAWNRQFRKCMTPEERASAEVAIWHNIDCVRPAKREAKAVEETPSGDH